MKCFMCKNMPLRGAGWGEDTTEMKTADTGLLSHLQYWIMRRLSRTLFATKLKFRTHIDSVTVSSHSEVT